MSKDHTLYEQTVEVSEEYLGPAAERFMRRQITTHLKIKPEALKQKDLVKLIDWSSIAFALMTKNTEDIDAFKRDLKSLASKGR